MQRLESASPRRGEWPDSSRSAAPCARTAETLVATEARDAATSSTTRVAFVLSRAKVDLAIWKWTGGRLARRTLSPSRGHRLIDFDHQPLGTRWPRPPIKPADQAASPRVRPASRRRLRCRAVARERADADPPIPTARSLADWRRSIVFAGEPHKRTPRSRCACSKRREPALGLRVAPRCARLATSLARRWRALRFASARSVDAAPCAVARRSRPTASRRPAGVRLCFVAMRTSGPECFALAGGVSRLHHRTNPRAMTAYGSCGWRLRACARAIPDPSAGRHASRRADLWCPGIVLHRAVRRGCPISSLTSAFPPVLVKHARTGLSSLSRSLRRPARLPLRRAEPAASSGKLDPGLLGVNEPYRLFKVASTATQSNCRRDLSFFPTPPHAASATSSRSGDTARPPIAWIHTKTDARSSRLGIATSMAGLDRSLFGTQ